MKVLLEIKETLSSRETQTHRSYRFSVPEACRKLIVKLNYSPGSESNEERAKHIIMESQHRYAGEGEIPDPDSWRKYLPLKNLMTVSLDDPVEFRGACHRKADFQILTVSESEASPGLLPGAIHPGEWQVTLSFHAIVTETCDYELMVLGSEENL